MVKLEMILINKLKYNLEQAIKYLDDNDYKYDDIEETKNYFKFRQLQYDSNVKYYSKVINKDIKMVFVY